ncbi:MAG: chain length-determining protein [Thioalkalivibrio sp.]|nr:MAG: chain length-determining protein [Thioalkalivibrio sp.]
MDEMLAQALGYLRGIWRYRWVALLVAWVVAVAGWVHVSQMPDQYQASAQVHVDTDSVLRPLMTGLAVEPNVQQRVDMMTRTLLTRPTLETVARETDMHLRATTEAQMNAVIAGLRTNLSIQQAGGQRRGRDAANVYTVAYTAEDPRQAYAVVQSLLNQFVEGFLGDTRVDRDTAQRFLDQQIREYEQRLEAAEQRLADFRRQNAGLLPGDRGDYYQRLQRAQEELRQTELELREAVNRRDEIQRQLASGTVNTGSSVSLTPTLDTRIDNVQTRLDELSLSFTDRHPDIAALRRTLEDLEQQRNEALEMFQQGLRTDASALEQNPVYQQMRMTLSQVQVEVSSLEVRAAEHRRRIDELQGLVDTVPQIEAELKRLDRDYNVNQQQFAELLQRRERAAMSQSLEDRGDRVQFRVIEPARVPLSPSGPDRFRLSTAVLFLGLLAGGGVSFLLSQVRPMFYDRRVLSAVTGFPVLGTVSLSRNAPRRFRERLEISAFMTISAALLLAFGVVIASGGLDLALITEVFR